MCKKKKPFRTFTVNLEKLVEWAYRSHVSPALIVSELLDAAAMVAAQVGIKPDEIEKLMKTSTVKAFVVYGQEVGQA